jgi:hypothetical protein
MANLDSKIFGTPDGHAEAKKGPDTLVTAPEFDVTQYAKKLAVIVGVIFPAAIAAAKAAKVDITSDIVVAGFVVTAAALIAVSVVMAVDVGARAYATAHAGSKADASDSSASAAAGPVAAPPGMKVWLKDRTGAFSVLAIDHGSGSTSYLVAGGSTSKKQLPGERHEVEAYDDAPSWISDKDCPVIATFVPSQTG